MSALIITGIKSGISCGGLALIWKTGPIFIRFCVYSSIMGMMDGMWGGYQSYGYGFPFWGWGILLIWLVLFLVIGYLVYQDANKRGMNGLLWGILVIIPMAGLLFLVIYIIIRETGMQKTGVMGKAPMDILRERYAQGEITSEQFQKMSEDLKK